MPELDIPHDEEGGFNILDEARRIAQGQTRAEAEAERARDRAQLPHLIEDLGMKTAEYTAVVENRNTVVSNQLGMGVASKIQQAGEVLDKALDAAEHGENPEPDRKRALDEYFRYFLLGRIRPEIVAMLDKYQLRDWPTSKEEEKKRLPAGNDLIPPLALAKMVYAMHERAELGLPEKLENGSVGYAVLERPRLRSKEERWQLAEQAVKGWFTFIDALSGEKLEEEYIERSAKAIVARAKEEFVEKGGG